MGTHRTSLRSLAVVMALAVLGTACSSAESIAAEPADESTTTAASVDPSVSVASLASELPVGEAFDYGPAPEIPEGDYAPEVAEAIDTLFGRGTMASIFTDEQNDALVSLGDSNDPRVVWILLDMFRFSQSPTRSQRIVDAANAILDADATIGLAFRAYTDRLIAWDVPAPPSYTETKRAIYSSILPEWGALFDDSEGMDWRLVSWGGVSIDNRPFDTTDDPCNCIPAADNPETEPGAEATWLDDDDIVFGVVINGEARAYPRQIMEVREMVNDTLGGRDFAMPYCTLCGAAQVWFTDNLPEGVDRPVFRTSGLLSRSNKVMYDLNTFSVFDTFVGDAQTGPLAAQGIQLDGHTVVTSTWVDWLAAHPDTDVLIEDLALGRDFDFRNGRDANGPIFPIGDVDPRLAVQEDVLGVLAADGTPVAFHVNSAITALDAGLAVEANGIRLVKDSSGVRATDLDGNEIVGHQAFWFAWSQFYPGTELWPSA